MKRILFVGQKPETADFTDPAPPPASMPQRSTSASGSPPEIEECGWQGDTCMITPDAAGSTMLDKALRATTYDCVVIGGRLAIPPDSLALFEMVVNIVHEAAPDAAIAFNTRPEDTAEAAARQLGVD